MRHDMKRQSNSDVTFGKLNVVFFSETYDVASSAKTFGAIVPVAEAK